MDTTEIRSLADIRGLARARRRELGLTQAEAALRAGVSRQFVSYFERGEGGDLITTLRLLSALQVTLLAVAGSAADSAASVDLVHPPKEPDASVMVDLDAHLSSFDRWHRALGDDRG